ncbi:MAG TPA: cytochrome c biogenesis protein CcdA [Anaerolineae bacterium]|nr:cytochrome c biogenesis protein CcdA [Anaerolineae bacterium]HOR00620.1 cytochrome c biogenesis protein CcdA [Anaerolineae bacterium]HPL28835.1 cytochrome c biogenesis protein CcdA [Anaerolineae bacterium]
MPPTDNLSVGLAFVAGLFSFLSPCVLPLVPIYIGYLSGTTVADQAGSRARTLGHAGAFVGGFTLVFVALGSLAGLAGYVATAPAGPLGVVGRIAQGLNQATPWLSRVGGVLLMVLGLHLTGLVRIPWLYRELRLETNGARRGGLVTSGLVGMAFAAGWTPCVGPYLMAILVLASNTGTVAQGALLLAVYSLGLGLPFLLAGLALGAVSAYLRKLNRYLNLVSIIGGGLLIAMGLLLVTGRFAWLNGLLNRLWQPPVG